MPTASASDWKLLTINKNHMNVKSNQTEKNNENNAP